VDDIVVTGDDESMIAELKAHLSTVFYIKDLGALRYFLGIEVTRSKKGIFIYQRKYALDMLQETGTLGSKPVDTPLEVNHRLKSEDGDNLEDPGQYQRLVGKLIY
jgi:hypothetical protein